MSALIARRSVRRSEYVEAIVALALKDSGWTRMTPWDSWDCEHESGSPSKARRSDDADGAGERAARIRGYGDEPKKLLKRRHY